MTDENLGDRDCLQQIAIIFAGLEVWLRTQIDPTGRDRDDALTDLLVDLAIHFDRLSGQDIDSSPATFAAEDRILNVLDWMGIATNDMHSLIHLAAGCTLQARDPNAVNETARQAWECLRSGTASSSDEQVSPALFIRDTP